MRQGASDAAELAAAVGRDRARSHLARGGGGADRAAWGRARTVQEVGIRVLYRTRHPRPSSRMIVNTRSSIPGSQRRMDRSQRTNSWKGRC